TALATLVDDYLAHCRARGLAPNTVNQAYRYPLLGVLLRFCEREGIADVARINARVLDRLSAQLLESGGRSGQPLSPHSVHSYSRAINHFLSWAQEGGGAGRREGAASQPAQALGGGFESRGDPADGARRANRARQADHPPLGRHGPANRRAARASDQ